LANIVITGSTRGIGLGLAKAFRALGHNVVISSRGNPAVDKAVAEVEAAPGSGEVVGIACDVGSETAVQALWNGATKALGRVDIWINNAGLSGPRKHVSEMTRADVEPVINTNIWGMIWGTQIPYRGMLAQGGGKIFNFEGFGSDGMSAPGLSVYGATKRALTYLTKSVNKEIKGSPVLLGTISPGIVVTDLLDEAKDADPAQWERTKKFYNILADRVETVAPYIADKVLAADKPGTAIKWLTQGKAFGRFATAWFTKRKVMPD
jgi:NAD(P)-dependent dehydrogenase (short-subunit alcohol dehydrogenase family)